MSVQDNVAIPVTAMMVTVCISTDALSSVLVYLIPTASISAVGPSCLLQPVLTECNSLFPTYLYHSVTSDWYNPDNPTDCSSLIQLWYHICIRPEGATGCNRSGVFACVVKVTYRKPPNISPGLIFVRKHFLVGLYIGGRIYGEDFVLVILTIYWLYFFITQG